METLQAWITTWLDPKVVGAAVMDWGGRIIGALVIFVIGRMLMRGLTTWATVAMRRVGMDDTLSRFLGNLLYIVLLVFLGLTVFQTLGVPTTNFLAIVGAAGLAVGLALKDSLANFSSGVMLVFFRPFRVGDTVQAGGVNGLVESIGIFSTIVKTPDNAVIIVPNSLVYAGTITNLTAEAMRRIDLIVALGYENSLKDAKALLSEVVRADERLLQTPAPEIVVDELGPNGVSLALRVWVATADKPAARAALLERIKESFEE